MKQKSSVSVGDELLFVKGQYVSLTGKVLSVDWRSKDPRSFYGMLVAVSLSNGEIGYLENSDHWEYV